MAKYSSFTETEYFSFTKKVSSPETRKPGKYLRRANFAPLLCNALDLFLSPQLRFITSKRRNVVKRIINYFDLLEMDEAENSNIFH